ncbi:MAG TPA: tetraacyldisaccharide 4'-kinase [Tepidisphaeraceae bacterium]|nr:tetraacyldisaccharide 4'-kinase [Tepidisphaeraceae bacterium]
MALDELIDVLSGARHGVWPATLRAMLTAAEVPYSGIMRVRNGLYDLKILRARRLPRPTISIGNLTTGGTGKTPLVCWLATELRARGRRPAVLMRGYHSNGRQSDEAKLIAQFIPAESVIANPNRIAGAASALEKQPQTDLFLLDDSMQHRRAGRDVEIVLISAVEPWGYGHVLPRGLLREPISGLARADAIVLTHISEVSPFKLLAIKGTVRQYNGEAPIFSADHMLTGLLSAGGEELPLTTLADRKYFIACAIAQPVSFLQGLKRYGEGCVGHQIFPDHYAFEESDVAELRKAAKEAGATAIIVTEKDWTKLGEMPSVRESDIPFWRTRLSMAFAGEGSRKLLELVLRKTAN